MEVFFGSLDKKAFKLLNVTILNDCKIYKGTETIESDEFLDALDEDLMKQTFEVAHQDYLAGRCIPNSQVVDYVKTELGWK